MEQRQRFRQREGLKERSAVVDTVEDGIYRAQWTEGFSHISYRGRKLSITTYSQPGAESTSPRRGVGSLSIFEKSTTFLIEDKYDILRNILICLLEFEMISTTVLCCFDNLTFRTKL